MRLLRPELGGLLVPEPGCRGIGRDAARVRRAEHGGIVGLRQDERGLCLMGIGGALEQQSRGGEVAGVEQALRPLQQGGEFVGIETPCRGPGAGIGAPRAGGWRISGWLCSAV